MCGLSVKINMLKTWHGLWRSWSCLLLQVWLARLEDPQIEAHGWRHHLHRVVQEFRDTCTCFDCPGKWKDKMLNAGFCTPPHHLSLIWPQLLSHAICNEGLQLISELKFITQFAISIFLSSGICKQNPENWPPFLSPSVCCSVKHHVSREEYTRGAHSRRAGCATITGITGFHRDALSGKCDLNCPPCLSPSACGSVKHHVSRGAHYRCATVTGLTGFHRHALSGKCW